MSAIKNVLIISSPHSGRAGELTHALDFIRQHGINIVDTLSIAELDGLPPQGTRWQERGVNLVVAAGGDGLVGGVITHIAECGLPLGILPLGTANDIARSLAIPQHVQAAAETLITGQKQLVDIGIAYPAQQAPHPAQKQHDDAIPVAQQVFPQKHGYFAHVLTVGLNVQFARIATNVASRQRFGRLTYPFAALEVLRNHVAIDMQLRFEELALYRSVQATDIPSPMPVFATEPVQLQCRALQATVINAPIFGGQWQLAIPGASLSDGLLDIVVIEEVEPGRLSSTFARLFSPHEHEATAFSEWHTSFPMLHPAELTGIPGVHHVRARGVTITTNADPQDVTLDGEVRGQTPVRTRIADERLCVIVPQRA